MDKSVTKYTVTERELARGRNLKIAAVVAPFLMTGIPAVLFTTLAILFGTTPPAAFTLFVFGIIFTAIGFIAGMVMTGILAYRRSNWTKEIREKIAADGIRADEIEWFMHELRAGEKKALKEIGRSDLLLADAYRETLASRLTATRIVRSSRKELSLVRRRRIKVDQLKSRKGTEFRDQIEKDTTKILDINEEAKQMLAEAEARLQMIEAAAVRGSSLANSELALKKLSSRAKNLPLALEEVRLSEEISRELERELSDRDLQGEEFRELTVEPSNDREAIKKGE